MSLGPCSQAIMECLMQQWTWRNLWFHTGDRGRMDEDGIFSLSIEKRTSSGAEVKIFLHMK